MTTRVTRKIVVGGREYSSPEQMPADVRAVYDKAMSMLADKNANGIPDVFEDGGKSLAGIAGASHAPNSRITITTTTTTSFGSGSSRVGGAPVDPASLAAPAGMTRANRWVVLLLVAAGVLLALRLLGLAH